MEEIIPTDDLEQIKEKLYEVVTGWPTWDEFREQGDKEDWENINTWFSYVVPLLVHAVENSNIDKVMTTKH